MEHLRCLRNGSLLLLLLARVYEVEGLQNRPIVRGIFVGAAYTGQWRRWQSRSIQFEPIRISQGSWKHVADTSTSTLTMDPQFLTAMHLPSRVVGPWRCDILKIDIPVMLERLTRKFPVRNLLHRKP